MNFQVGRETTKHDDEEQPALTGHELPRQGGVYEEMSWQVRIHIGQAPNRIWNSGLKDCEGHHEDYPDSIQEQTSTAHGQANKVSILFCSSTSIRLRGTR